MIENENAVVDRIWALIARHYGLDVRHKPYDLTDLIREETTANWCRGYKDGQEEVLRDLKSQIDERLGYTDEDL